MLTLEQALKLEVTAEVNWGELATDLLTEHQQEIYESLRLPAWVRYQGHVARFRDIHWTITQKYMPKHWEEYRIELAYAFKMAATEQSPNQDILGDILVGGRAA